MKKFGQIMFSFVPFILGNAIQYIALFFTMGISALILFSVSAATQVTSFSSAFDQLFYLISSYEFSVVIMIVYSLLCIAVFGIWYYCKYDGNYLVNPRHIFHPLSILGIVMLVIGMQYLATYIMNITAALFPHALEIYMDLIENAGLGDDSTISMVLYSVILAPFCEEFIFRGVTMRQAKKCMPFWLANVFQAVLFGVFHMNLIQGVYAFALGVFLGYVCEKGGSIYHSILLHILFNVWGTFLNEYLYVRDNTFSVIFFFFFSIAISVGGIFVFGAGITKTKAQQSATLEM